MLEKEEIPRSFPKRNSTDREPMPMSSLITIWCSKLSQSLRDNLLTYCSPISPAHMDWSSYYPAFAEPEPTEAKNLVEVEQTATEAKEQAVTQSSTSATFSKGVRKLIKDVEVADIGCGFGGLLVALAPKLPDTLMLGMLYLQESMPVANAVQVWRFEHKSQNTSKRESKLCESKLHTRVCTRTRRVYVQTA